MRKKMWLGSFVLFLMTVNLLLSAEAFSATKITAGNTKKAAPLLKENVTYQVSQKTEVMGYGYLRFKPAQTGTYKIVISNYKTDEENSDYGNLFIEYLSKDLKTNGGTCDSLKMATKGLYDYDVEYGSVDPGNPTVDDYLATRYGEAALKKGKNIYLSFFSTNLDGVCSYQVKITRIAGTTLKEKAPAFSGLKVNRSKKVLQLSWKKNSKLTGYQVQMAANSKFSKASTKTTKKTSVQFSYKAGKKYYFRIRGYKTSSGVKKYTAWSKKQSRKMS